MNIYDWSAVYIFWLLLFVALQVAVFYKKLILFLSIFLISVLVGGGLAFQSTHERLENRTLLESATSYFTKETSIEWTLTEKTAEKKNGTVYILRNIRVGGKDLPDSLGLSASFSRTYDISVGDKVVFTGAIRAPSSNIGGFDYQKYLELQDVYGTVSVSLYRKIGADDVGYIVQNVRVIREKILQSIHAIYPWETAMLLEGILIGERSGLSEATKDDFNRAGLTHIVAVSGSNITIILVFLSLLLRSFPILIQALAIIGSITLFTLIVWFQAPVLRASVFWVVAYMALLVGRRVRIFPVLVAIALLFVLIDPLILNYDVSFHLSFLAVFGLIFFKDFFEKIFSWIPRLFVMRESLVLTLAAMAFTIPIMIVEFGQLSIIAPIANIFIVPVMPLVMFFGTLSLVVAPFFSSLGVVIGYGGYTLLHYMLSGAHFFWALPFSSIAVDLGMYKYVIEILYFIILIFLLLLKEREKDSV